MTGLDPVRNVIVEIATLVTDDSLDVVAEGPDLVVHQPPEALAVMEDVVREMHRARLPAARTPAATASAACSAGGGRGGALDFIRSHVPHPIPVPLCGNSIGTDRQFPGASAASRTSCTTGRSTCPPSEVALQWAPAVVDGAPRRTTTRALDDIRESVNGTRCCRQHLFKLAAAEGQVPG